MTAATVTICGCGHAERMHERDEAADSGRGACMHGACGCSEMRADAKVPPTLAPVASIEVEKPEPVAAPSAPTGEFACRVYGCDATFTQAKNRVRHEKNVHDERITSGSHACPDCERTFATPSALGPHRRYAHGFRLPEAAKQGSPSQTGSSAAGPSVRPGNEARLASSGTATTEKPAATVGDAPNGPAGLRHSASLHIDLGAAGYVDITATAIRADKLTALLDLVAHYLRTTEGNQS